MVLDFLNAHVFCEEESVEQCVHLCGAESGGCGFCRFDDGIFDFIERESFGLSVALLDELGERLHCDEEMSWLCWYISAVYCSFVVTPDHLGIL